MTKEETKQPIVYKTEDILGCGRFCNSQIDFLQVLLTAEAYTLAQVKALIEAEMERVID